MLSPRLWLPADRREAGSGGWGGGASRVAFELPRALCIAMPNCFLEWISNHLLIGSVASTQLQVEQ